ncbi:MAG: bifunctional metallophosphatase/5'-nucleotidase, partial [Saprospiraceae bacterium]|nr:bifunctional metallophosphatase/5'-nucleotidase [Saprospiraceae bacterium]
EIAPLEGGKTGGLARVATLRKDLQQEGKPNLALLAGDFLSPSLIGTLKKDGSRIAGAHMVDCMNAAGIDLVTFGNHEFDLSMASLQKRIDESNFEWISSNVLQNYEDGLKHRFYKMQDGQKNYVKDTYIWEIADKDGTLAKIGFFGVTLSTFPVDYVHYEDPFLEARKAYEHLQSQCNLVLGVTHLAREQDSLLALELPNVPLLMGGHDHENMKFKTGNCIVAKADANAKTAYIHRIRLNTSTGKADLQSDLIALNESVGLDPLTSERVAKWYKILDETIKQVYPNPNELIYRTAIPLEGREYKVRSEQTNLGQMVVKSMRKSVSVPVQGSFFNSGGIRIDDQLVGDVTSQDIFRVLPYGGEIFVVDIKGDLLQRVLEYSEANRGSGAYLQRDGFSFKDGKWYVGERVIDKNETYTIALNDFLLKGFDIPFLIDDPKLILKKIVPEKGSLAKDVRLGLIDYLKKGGE